MNYNVYNSLIFTPPHYDSLGNVGTDSPFCFIHLPAPADYLRGGVGLFWLLFN